MGTRALIRYNGDKYLYTHWDGMPSDLGVELKRLKTHTKDAVKRVALKHEVDYNFDTKMWYENNRPSHKGIHNDWVDYEYDVRPNGVYVRKGGYNTKESDMRKGNFMKV